MTHTNMAEGYQCRYNYVLLQSDNESTDSADEKVNLLNGMTESDTDNKKDVSFGDDGQEDKNYEYIWLSDDEIISEPSLVSQANTADNTSGPESDIVETMEVGNKEHKDVTSEGENRLKVIGQRNENTRCKGRTNEQIDTVRNEFLHSNLPEQSQLQKSERNTSKILNQRSSSLSAIGDLSTHVSSKNIGDFTGRRNASDADLTRKPSDPALTKSVSDFALTKNNSNTFTAARDVCGQALKRNVSDPVLTRNIWDQALTTNVSINQTLSRKVSNPVFPGNVTDQPVTANVDNPVFSGNVSNQPVARNTSIPVFKGNVSKQPVTRNIGNSIFPGKVGNQPVSRNIGNSIFPRKVGNQPVTRNIGNTIFPGKVGNQPVSRNIGNSIFPRKVGNQHVTKNIDNSIFPGKVGDQLVTSNAGDPVFPGNVSDQPVSRNASNPIFRENVCDQLVTSNAGDPVFPENVSDQPVTKNAGDPVFPGKVGDQLVTRNASNLNFPGNVCDQPVTRNAGEPIFPGNVSGQPVKIVEKSIFPGNVSNQPVTRNVGDLVSGIVRGQPVTRNIDEPIFPGNVSDQTVTRNVGDLIVSGIVGQPVTRNIDEPIFPGNVSDQPVTRNVGDLIVSGIVSGQPVTRNIDEPIFPGNVSDQPVTRNVGDLIVSGIVRGQPVTRNIDEPIFPGNVSDQPLTRNVGDLVSGIVSGQPVTRNIEPIFPGNVSDQPVTRNIGDPIVSGIVSGQPLTRNIDEPIFPGNVSDQPVTRNVGDPIVSGIVSGQPVTRNIDEPIFPGNVIDQPVTRNVGDPIVSEIVGQPVTRNIDEPIFPGNDSDQHLARNISDTASRIANDQVIQVECIVHSHASSNMQDDTVIDIGKVQEERSTGSNKCLDNKCRKINREMKAVVVDNNLTEEDGTIISVEKISELKRDGPLSTEKKSDSIPDTVAKKSKKRNIRTQGRWHNDMVSVTNAKILKYLQKGKKNNRHYSKKLETVDKSNLKEKCQADDKMSVGVKNKESSKCKVPVTSSRKKFKEKVKPEQDASITTELCPAFDRCDLGGESPLKMALKKQTDVINEVASLGKRTYKISRFRRRKSLLDDSSTNISKKGLTENAKEESTFNAKEGYSAKAGLSYNKKGGLIASEKGFWIRTDNAKEEFWIRKNEALYGLKKVRDVETKIHDPATEELANENDNLKCSEPMLKESNVKSGKSDMLYEMKKKSETTDTVKPNRIKKDKKCKNTKSRLLKKIQTKRMPHSKNWMRFMPTPTTGKLLEGKLKDSKEVNYDSVNLPKAEKNTLPQDLKDVYEIENIDVIENKDTKLYKRKINDAKIVPKGKGKPVTQTEVHNSKMNDNARESSELFERKINENQYVRSEHNEIGLDNVKAFEGSGPVNCESPNDTISEVNDSTLVTPKTIDSEQLASCSGNALEKDTTKLKRKRIRRKPVKVFSTRSGVRKIALRYPCRYCGELFSGNYVRSHEKKHGIEGQKKVYSRRNSDVRAEVDEVKVDDKTCLSTTRNDSLITRPVEQNSATDNTSSPSIHLIDNFCIEDSIAIQSETTEEKSVNTDIHVKMGLKNSDGVSGMTKVKNKMKRTSKVKSKKDSETSYLHENNIVTKQPTNIQTDGSSHLQCTSEKRFNDANTWQSPMNENVDTVEKEIKHLDKKDNPSLQSRDEDKQEELKRYTCTECSYSCSYKNILKRHLNIHKSISKRIVTCKCGITFRSKETLEQWHRRNNVSYQGDHVRKKKVRKGKQSGSKIQNHLRKIGASKRDTKILKSVNGVAHKYKRKKCGKCNYRFSNHVSWLNHEKLHENNTGYTCEECSITMKTKFSLSCWHYRHGILHHKRRRGKKTETEVSKKEKIPTSVCDPGENQDQQICSEALEVQEAANCTECGVSNIEKDTKHVKLNEKLDGTVCDTCSPKLAIREDSGSGTPIGTFSNGSVILVNTGDSVNDSVGTVSKISDMKNQADNVRESINNSLKELTKKISVQNEDKPRNHSIKRFKGSTVDRSKNIVQCFEQTADDAEILNSDRSLQQYDNIQTSKDVHTGLSDQTFENDGEFENERFEVFSTEGTVEKTLDCKDVPVYPLVKRLSLRDGEMIYSPVNNEIEVFEKESDITENYRKIKVLDIDTTGCLEKPDESLTNEINEYGKDCIRENQLVCRNEISEVISNEPVDLSVKGGEVEDKSVEDKPSTSIMFEIQIDLERKEFSDCRPLTQEICNNTNSIRAKITLKNLNVIENVQGKGNDNCNESLKGAENTGIDKKTCPRDKNINKRNQVIAVHSENSYNDKLNVDSHNRDVFAFTEDEDDDVYYFASKLQEKPCSDEYALDLETERDDQLDNMDANILADTGETSVCDTGETDENNNRTQEGQNKTTDRNTDSTGDDGDTSRNAGNTGGRGNSGGGERDDNGDEEENNDRNNDESNRDENYNVELFPCLVCQETFQNKTELLRHLTKIHRLTNMCQICYFDEGEIRRFANPVSLRNHKVRDHPEDMVKCVCGAMLIDNKMLSSHLKKFKCNIYDSVGESNEMAKCICGKRFASQQMLLNHRSKCRKRHCLDDAFLEYMSSSHKGKRRCLKTSTVENERNNDNESTCMTLRGKAADINNNMNMSEDGDTSYGRMSKVRKCKENVVTYNEKLYDKYFESAVNLSKRSSRKSYNEVEHTRRYERLSATQKLSDTEEVLDLRTKSARDRNNNTWSEKVHRGSDIPDLNNNMPQETWTVSNVELKSNCKSGQYLSTDSVYSNQKGILNQGSGVKLTFKKHSFDKKQKQTSSSLSQSLADRETRLTKSEIDSQHKKTSKGRRKKKFQPDLDGRYPCKICRRRYKRPYLYTHQKIAHAKKQWVLVPTSSLQKKPDENVKYRCSWCRFVCVHWGTAVRHHYMLHQEKELVFIHLTSVPESFLELQCEYPPMQYEENMVYYMVNDML